MFWKWIQISLIFALSAADTYTEDLIITKLPSGHFLSQFAFSISSDLDSNGKEYELFPRVMAELISQYSVKELVLSLGMGRWSAEEWGIPPQPSSPTGAYVHAWIQGNETEVNVKWQRVINSLNGIICTSLTRIFPTLTSSPQLLASTTGSYDELFKFRYAALAKESVCTENLTPWRKLLPCKQNGLTTLLNPLKLYNSHFHSMNMKIIPGIKKNTWNLILTLKLVSQIPVHRNEIDIETIFGRSIVGSCRAAQRSSIWIEASEDIHVSAGSKRIGKYVAVDINDDMSSKNPRIDLTSRHLPRPSSFISVTSKIGGADSYTGKMITIVTNSGSSVKASFTHIVPWFVQINYHTLHIRCEKGNRSVKPLIYKHFFAPAISREMPAVIEYEFELPEKSQCFVEFNFKKAFLRLREYPPDANHGMYIPSAILTTECLHTSYPGNDLNITTNTNDSRIVIHGNVLLVVLPVPDFSMPFNVICLVLTTITFCFAPIHNFSTKMFVPLNSNLPKKPKYRKALTVGVLILLGANMWSRFHPATKKKSRGITTSRTKDLKNKIQTVESHIDESVIKIFADNCADLHAYLEKCWNTDLDDEESQNISVAIVNCSFSHVSYFRKALQINTKKLIFPIKSDSPLKVTVEKMKHSKPSVFLIEQFESHPVEYVENLITLVRWFSLRHSFILCVSTGIDAFMESCSLPLLRCVNTAIFNMPEPVSVLEVIMKNVFETAITNNFYLSSEVLTLLRLRYLYNSFSINELKKILRLCIQHNIWKTPVVSDVDEEQDEFEENVGRYMKNLEFYCSAMGLHMYKCHEEIQAGAFDPNRLPIKSNILEEWVKQNCVTSTMRTKMEECLSTYDFGRKNQQVDKAPTIMAKSNKKMSALEFRQLAEANRTATLKEKQTNPEILFQKAFNSIFHDLLSPWADFPGSHVQLIKTGPENGLHCNPGSIIEKALLAENNKSAPLSVAYRTLQQRPNWKSVRIVDWLKYYKDELPENVNPVSFHAALAQLESMGVIKINNEKSKSILMVIRHPVSHTLN